MPVRCPICLEIYFGDIDPQVTDFQCPVCESVFPILFKFSIETIQDFIDAANDNNLHIALRDNLGRRYLKPKTKQYFEEILQKSIDYVLYKHEAEYLLVLYCDDAYCNIDTFGFVIEKTGIEKTAVKVI